MRLFGEFRDPGVGDPDLEGAQSLITQSSSVFGDPLPHVTVSHELHVTCNWRVEGPTGEGHHLLSVQLLTGQSRLMSSSGRNVIVSAIRNRYTTIRKARWISAAPSYTVKQQGVGVGR